jgi:predicted ATP-grasp superfamily ATP-dependent carboligase
MERAVQRGIDFVRRGAPGVDSGAPPVPAILLGGRANALSAARSLGRMGVPVQAINEPRAFVRHSRFCTPVDVPPGGAGANDVAAAWARFLLGPASDPLRGAALLACCDEAIELIVRHRAPLAARFRLDDSNPEAQLAMLDKLATYRAAEAAGVPTPRFWVAQTPGDLHAARHELVFPLIVKPRLSHVFEARSGKKLLIARDLAEAVAAFDAVSATGSGALLVELIPGPDDRLCSYFTYLDADSRPLFHFTKRVIRRYPMLSGNGCYHVTDWIPDIGELANRLFRHVGLKGVANVEFKRDDRDGQFKLIECNARLTASDALIARSGVDLAAFVYCRLVGRRPPPMDQYRTGMRLWDPVRDFQAYLELRRAGRLTFPQWLSSVMHRQTFPYFEWTDPLPALVRLMHPVRNALGRLTLGRGGGRSGGRGRTGTVEDGAGHETAELSS